MIKKYIASLALGLVLVGSAGAQIISQWTFETSAPTTAGPVSPEVGSGSALSTTGGTFTSPVGDGSSKSWSSNGWDVGDYFQFQVSTATFSSIYLIWDQTGSNSGPRDFSLQYSTDGSSFTAFGTYSVIPNNSPNIWGSSSYVSAAQVAFDLSSITAINNQTTVYFRLIDTSTVSTNGGTVAVAGSSRIDNFTVSQGFVSITPVPEPQEYAVCVAGLLGLVIFMMRRRRNAV